MSEREEAALKCAQHIIKIKRTHSDYRDSWFGGESNLATEFMLLRQRVQTAERERDEARRERDALEMSLAKKAESYRASVLAAEAETKQWKEFFYAERHRAERAERVVERINGIRLSPLCCDGENNAEVDAYHDGFNAAMEEVRDAIRALDAEAQP